jgi:hypothetical protein
VHVDMERYQPVASAMPTSGDDEEDQEQSIDLRGEADADPTETSRINGSGSNPASTSTQGFGGAPAAAVKAAGLRIKAQYFPLVRDVIQGQSADTLTHVACNSRALGYSQVQQATMNIVSNVAYMKTTQEVVKLRVSARLLCIPLLPRPC